jgi:hypothetical protein
MIEYLSLTKILFQVPLLKENFETDESISSCENNSFEVRCNLRETFHSLPPKGNKTRAYISSDVKCFCNALEGKCFL